MKWLTRFVLFVMGLSAFGLAHAQSWPSKPVRLVVPFPAGGPLDLQTRVIADRLSNTLGQSFVTENRSGAGGNIGVEAVAKSAPDGHTVLVTLETPFTVNPFLYRKIPFRTEDFRPVFMFGTTGMLAAVHASVPVANLKELIALLKAKPLAYSTAGIGSPGHLATEFFGFEAGFKANHVPYKGNVQASTDLATGQVQFAVLGAAGLLPFVQAGKVRALAVTTPARSTLVPDTPTMAEAGFPNIEVEFSQGFFVPTGTPDAVVERLANEIARIMASPEMRERMAKADYRAHSERGPEFAARLARNTERWSKVVKMTGMTNE
jgi:tripartite-type tricarboxylate transporter receptor subunit TctC